MLEDFGLSVIGNRLSFKASGSRRIVDGCLFKPTHANTSEPQRSECF